MLLRRALTVVGMAATITAAAAPAWALDCNNQSRPAPDTSAGCTYPPGGGPCVYTIDGHWAYISWDANPADANWTFLPPGFYGNGNYQDGQGWALLDNSAAICNGARLAPADGGTNTHGVVAGGSMNTSAQPCR